MGRRPLPASAVPVTFPLVAKCNCKAWASGPGREGRMAWSVRPRADGGTPHPRNCCWHAAPVCQLCHSGC